MKYGVWYMKPDWFREGITGAQPDRKNLAATHVFLKDVEGIGKEDIFHKMQGEVWSPNGEARGLIKAKGLAHTSMSVGDVLTENDRTWIVASVGFKELN